jgi:hypothetical protein
MTTHLNADFWSEWLPSASILDSLHVELLQASSLNTKQLTEIAVRKTVEAGSGNDGIRVYSPEQRYRPGETIFFVTNRGRKLAQILDIDHGRLFQGMTYDAIRVRYASEISVREFVSNCPEFPLRYSTQWSAKGSAFMTPGMIAIRFYDTISRRLRDALQEDERFIEFGDVWAAQGNIVSLGPRQIETVIQLLRQRSSLRCSEIADKLFLSKPAQLSGCSLEFSVAVSLRNDRLRRFLVTVSDDGPCASLSPPVKEVTVTLSSTEISNGSIPISTELKKMLWFYVLKSPITLKVYGDYEVHGLVDDLNDRIVGAEIADWFSENDIQPGTKIYIKAPDQGSNSLRLYTLHEESKSRSADPKVKEYQRRQHLRHNIFALFRERQEYLHYREITSLLNERSIPAREDSVEANLSHNTHLFSNRYPSKGLWGLLSWETNQETKGVSATALALTIAEEKWVNEVLKRSGVPLSPRDICCRLAEVFQVRVEQINQLSFLDPSDRSLFLFADGRWGLAEWISTWKKRAAEISRLLDRASATRDLLDRYQSHHKDLIAKLHNDRSRSADLGANQNELSRRASQYLHDIADLEASEVVCRREREGLVRQERTMGWASSLSTIAIVVGMTGTLTVLSMYFGTRTLLTLKLNLLLASATALAVAGRAWAVLSMKKIRQNQCQPREDVNHIAVQVTDLRAKHQNVENDQRALQSRAEELQQSLEETKRRIHDLEPCIEQASATLQELGEEDLTLERDELRQLLPLAETSRRQNAR